MKSYENKVMAKKKKKIVKKKTKATKKKTKAFMRESFEYIKNQAKWKAAQAYCDDNNAIFKLITEKDLGSY